MLVPNSSDEVKSCSIPFAAVFIILAIIIVNIYIFFSYPVQMGRIHDFKKTIADKNHLISQLEHEQKLVKPTLQRSYDIASQLTRLKAERARLLATWRAIQQKGGRTSTSVSRGAMVRTRPYILNGRSGENTQTAITSLKENQRQLTGYLNEETKAQQELLQELLAYERRLDHTPSLWPVATRVSSWFGYRRHPIYGRLILHKGVDIQARYGTRVRAAADGVVKSAGYQSGYGYAVVIGHGYGYETLYAHNSRLVVSSGQSVKKGQVISYSGNSGSSTGPHLHFEVHLGNSPINPVGYLRN